MSAISVMQDEKMLLGCSRNKHARSKLTNGKLLPGCDLRTKTGRRYVDLIDLLTHEVSNGEPLPASLMATVRQTALCIAESEALQLASARGEPIDHDQLIRLTNLHLRLLAKLDRQRAKKATSYKPNQGRHPSVLGLLGAIDEGGGR